MLNIVDHQLQCQAALSVNQMLSIIGEVYGIHGHFPIPMRQWSLQPSRSVQDVIAMDRLITGSKNFQIAIKDQIVPTILISDQLVLALLKHILVILQNLMISIT